MDIHTFSMFSDRIPIKSLFSRTVVLDSLHGAFVSLGDRSYSRRSQAC